jgi:phage gpG-like protein
MIAGILIGDAASVGRLRRMRDTANREVARTVAKLGINLQDNIQQNKLSGEVLHIRTGALKQSIALRIEQSDATVSATVYSNLAYAAAQEYGFSGTVDVRASLRRIKEAFGHPIAAETVAVGAHGRRADLPARSFLRSALNDLTPTVNARVGEALREALS